MHSFYKIYAQAHIAAVERIRSGNPSTQKYHRERSTKRLFHELTNSKSKSNVVDLSLKIISKSSKRLKSPPLRED